MKKLIFKLSGVLIIFAMMISIFAGCAGSVVENPEAATVKTDLRDAYFTFSYGDLRKVLPGDKLASLFESTNKKTDDKTVTLSYYEICTKFDGEDLEGVLSLITDEEKAAFIGNQVPVLNYFNDLINDIKKTGKANVAYDENFWITHDSRVVFKDLKGNELEDQDKFRAAFKLYADKSLQNIDSYLLYRGQDEATQTGADLKNEIYPFGEDYASKLTLDDLYASIKENIYPVYSSLVPSQEHALDENGDNAKDEDGEYIFVNTDYTRTIIINVKGERDSVEKAFTIRDTDEILKEFECASAYMDVNSVEINFEPCKITATINAVSDQIAYCTYEKNMIVTANLTFKGPLSEYGNVLVTFPCTSSITYSFGWETEE